LAFRKCEELESLSGRGHDMKCLVIYYSYNGACARVSEAIQDVMHADILEVKPRGKSRWMYFFSRKPKIEPAKVSFEEYDMIFIGTPVWFGTFAPPLHTFLKEYKLEHKKVALFCCSKRYKGKLFEHLEELLKENKIVSKIELMHSVGPGLWRAVEKARKWAKDCVKLSNLG